MKPLYIFDLDGTLALIEHRRHFVENGANRWDEFHAACVGDKPNVPVIETMISLQNGGMCEIWIWSGRSDSVREQTMKWLANNTGQFWLPHEVKMRTHGDYTPDDVLKKCWYDTMLDVDKARLVATFDDRDRIVKMWRDLGVTCFQVAPGDF